MMDCACWIFRAPLEWSNSSTFLHSDFKTLESPIAALTLTREQCDQLMCPILQVRLPKSSYNRHFCCSTLFAPLSHLSTNMHDLYVTMVLAHITIILYHSPQDSPTGHLLCMSWRTIQLEMGFPVDFLQWPHKACKKFITPCWLTEMWKELEKYNIHLQHAMPSLLLQCVGNSFLTWQFVDVAVCWIF